MSDDIFRGFELDADEEGRIRPEIRALVARGNVTIEELKTIRCNSWEWEALVPAMNDEAFCERMQYSLDNCFTRRERPYTTYNQAIEGLYAPELLRRFAALGGMFVEATKKWQTYEREYILPCFKWAKEEGYDLERTVIDNPGKNCIELFFELRRGKCQACSIEAEIGTEEDPHPVPERFHTCPPMREVLSMAKEIARVPGVYESVLTDHVFPELFSSVAESPAHPDYVTITSGMRGYFAVHLVWNPDHGGFYEPQDTGVSTGRNSDDKHVVREAIEWAEELGVMFRTLDDHISNCSLANGVEEGSCQICKGQCPDQGRFK